MVLILIKKFILSSIIQKIKTKTMGLKKTKVTDVAVAVPEIPSKMELIKSEPKKANGIGDMLAKMNTATATTSKSKVQIIDNPKLYALVDDVLTKKSNLDDAKAMYEVAENGLLTHSDEWYRSKKGQETSVKFKGTKGFITTSYKNMFLKIPYENKEVLEQLCGDKFDDYFEEKRVIKMKDTTDEMIGLLIEKLGEDFANIFDVNLEIKPTGRMNELQFLLPTEVRNYVKQYKASVKA